MRRLALREKRPLTPGSKRKAVCSGWLAVGMLGNFP